MAKDKWDKYRDMTEEELMEAIDSGDSEAAAYQYIERDDDDEDCPLGGSIFESITGKSVEDTLAEAEDDEDDED